MVPRSFYANSAGIIEKLTILKTSINKIQRGDFLFWESKKISSRTGKNIRHIMYVAGVKMEGDLLQEVRVFDNSDVAKEATFRTISIAELNRKKKILVGTPKFLTQHQHFSEIQTQKERG